MSAPSERASADPVEKARTVLRRRRRRDAVFEPELFGEPAWDLLLALFLARSENRPLSTLALSREAPMAPAIALRWIDLLVVQGYVDRTAGIDPRDPLVSLTPRACELLLTTLGEDD